MDTFAGQNSTFQNIAACAKYIGKRVKLTSAVVN